MNKNTLSKDFKFIQTVGDISEFELKSNGLRVLYKAIVGTEVVTTNITYLVGSRDEQAGESGVAHMLEHMLFKPTKFDKENKTEASILKFERAVGPVMNANTWRDRTTYYVSAGVEHFSKILQIESERMRNVLLTDQEFQPERTNVLSEYDMYNGQPEFVLSEIMTATAFVSHPYGHETIGFKEDISAYTIEKLQRFYNHFYRPNNATLMVVGDIELKSALNSISEHFKHLEPEPGVKVRPKIIEPKQEGVRRVEIVRPGKTNIIAIGFKHAGFPSNDWFKTIIATNILTGGSDSVLNKKIIDTGLASSISTVVSPSKDTDLGTLFITLTSKTTHAKMETMVLKLIQELSEADIKKQLKSVINKTIADEIFMRESSLNIAAELTEYVSAENWPTYFKTEEILKSISAKDIKKTIVELFSESNLTIGNYKSI